MALMGAGVSAECEGWKESLGLDGAGTQCRSAVRLGVWMRTHSASGSLA